MERQVKSRYECSRDRRSSAQRVSCPVENPLGGARGALGCDRDMMSHSVMRFIITLKDEGSLLLTKALAASRANSVSRAGTRKKKFPRDLKSNGNLLRHREIGPSPKLEPPHEKKDPSCRAPSAAVGLSLPPLGQGRGAWTTMPLPSGRVLWDHSDSRSRRGICNAN